MQTEKLPQYLGIFTINDDTLKINKYVQDNLKLTSQYYPDDKRLLENLDELESKNLVTLKDVNDPHITTCYIGGDRKKTESIYYKSFVEGLSIDIKISAIAYVPDNIITGICYPDQSIIKIENNFPHITLITGGWAPNESNTLLQLLCDKGGPAECEYKDGGFEKLDEFCRKYTIKVDNKAYDAYIIKFIGDLILPGITKKSL